MMIQPSAITPPDSCSSEHSLPSNILIIIWLTWPIGRDCTCQMEKAMAAYSSTLAWKIPWMEEPDGLQSMGSLRVRHNWATSLSLFTFMHWRRKWQPTPVFLPGESRDGGAWWAAVCGVAQSRTRLKRLSSSSRSLFSMSVSLSLFCMEDHLYYLLRFHI